MEQAKAAGLRTGNVTTSEITDATPAAMFSHVTLRGCQLERRTYGKMRAALAALGD